MEVEEELHYEGEFPSGHDGAEVQPPASLHAEGKQQAPVPAWFTGQSGGCTGARWFEPELLRLLLQRARSPLLRGGWCLFAGADNEEEALPGEPQRDASLPRSPGFGGGPNCSSGEGVEEEEQQQHEQEQQQLQEDAQQQEVHQEQQEQEEGGEGSGTRSNGDLNGAALGGGPGGRRTQYRVLISNLDTSVQWQDLKDFGRKAGEVNYANVISIRGKKYGVLEYCEEASMEAAIRDLDGARLRGTEVILKRDRGDFDALLSSAPPRWFPGSGGGPRGLRPSGRLLRGAPRGPLSSSNEWYSGAAPEPSDLRMREHQRPGELSGGAPLRALDYHSRDGGPAYSGVRGSRLSGRGAPVDLGLPPERHHHGSYGGGGGSPPLPPLRGSRGGAMLVEEELLGPRRMRSPPRSSTRAAAQGPPPVRASRRSRSASPSWRGPPVHAGYRGASGKDAFAASRGGAAYEDSPAWREGPPPPSSHRDGGPHREGPRREHYRRNGGGLPSYLNGEEAEVYEAEEILGSKLGGYHGGRPLPPREMDRVSSPPPQHAYSRGGPSPASGGDRAMPALGSGGPSRGAWERGPRRGTGSPRRTRGPPPSAAFGGGPSSSRGFEGKGRSLSRERRPYDEAKRRRTSPPPAGGMLMCMYGSQPQGEGGDWRPRQLEVGGGGASLNTEAGVEGGPLVGYSRRRHRSRSPRGGREAPSYSAASHGGQLLSEGGLRQQHPYGANIGGGSAGPSGLGVGGPPGGGGPSRSSRSRREDLSAARAGGAGAPNGGGGPHHHGDDAYVNSWGVGGSSSRRGDGRDGDVWCERALVSSDASQQPQFGGPPPPPHRRGGGESPPMRRRHMGAPEGPPPPDARYVGSFGELRGRTSEHQGGAAGGHLPRGGVSTAEERRGGVISSSGSSRNHRGSGLQGGALGPPPPQPLRSGGLSLRDGAATLTVHRAPPHGGPQREAAAFGQLSYRA
ncbi:hypothetical protein Esti_001563 [Eimeria stiedai]